MVVDGASLPSEGVNEICARLAKLDDLRYPAQLENQEDVSESQKETYLHGLLLRDPGAGQLLIRKGCRANACLLLS